MDVCMDGWMDGWKEGGRERELPARLVYKEVRQVLRRIPSSPPVRNGLVRHVPHHPPPALTTTDYGSSHLHL
jgi:hypothetical protein